MIPFKLLLLNPFFAQLSGFSVPSDTHRLQIRIMQVEIHNMKQHFLEYT